MNKRKAEKGTIFQVALFVVIPIVAGGLIYYLFCPSVTFVKFIDSITNINVHITCDNTENIVILILRWYLFDFLWAFSFSSAVYLFFVNKRLSYTMSLIIPVVFGVVYEMLQKYGIAKGTFDIGDILAEFIASGLSVFSNIKYETRRKRQ